MIRDGVKQRAFMLTTNLQGPQLSCSANNYQFLMKVVHQGVKYLHTTPMKISFQLKKQHFSARQLKQKTAISQIQALTVSVTLRSFTKGELHRSPNVWIRGTFISLNRCQADCAMQNVQFTSLKTAACSLPSLQDLSQRYNYSSLNSLTCCLLRIPTASRHRANDTSHVSCFLPAWMSEVRIAASGGRILRFQRSVDCCSESPIYHLQTSGRLGLQGRLLTSPTPSHRHIRGLTTRVLSYLIYTYTNIKEIPTSNKELPAPPPDKPQLQLQRILITCPRSRLQYIQSSMVHVHSWVSLPWAPIQIFCSYFCTLGPNVVVITFLV